MAEPFLSEIRIFSFGFAPKGWALCNGQLMQINQNQALFSLLGTTYGGNGQTTFALPNLQGRVPMHEGSGFTLGQAGGETAHTLTINEMPQHLHLQMASNTNGDSVTPTGNFLNNFNNGYRVGGSLVTLIGGTTGNAGGSQPHQNMSPYITISFCIALQGIFPSPN